MASEQVQLRVMPHGVRRASEGIGRQKVPGPHGFQFPPNLAVAAVIVVYRLPITLRCAPEEVAIMTRRVLIERINHILALPPDEIDDAMR